MENLTIPVHLTDIVAGRKDGNSWDGVKNEEQIFKKEYQSAEQKQKQSVLIVDHNRKECNLILNHLRQFGYNASGVISGKKALEILEDKPFDLVLTESKMPDMSGIELLQIIKDTAHHVEVIIIASYIELESYLRAMSMGAFEYISKPIKTHELRRIIAKALSLPKKSVCRINSLAARNQLNKHFT